MKNLILIRHGESIWNLENRFTGWFDVGLTKKGKEEAENAGKLIKNLNIEINKYFTSSQKRAIETLSLAVKKLEGKKEIIKAWELNERHYGNLTGLNKKETEDKFGSNQVFKWRRSWDIAPPMIEMSNPYYEKIINSYKNIPESKIPKSESLKDTFNRSVPYFEEKVYPLIEKNNIIISAHGNSLRALCKKIFNISEKDICELNIPTGNPLLIEFKNFKEIKNFEYLDKNRQKKII
tara:strand:+ start:920 stop:1627 length:708 start_codon:yes stop_codon:yes gene_type:complete